MRAKAIRGSTELRDTMFSVLDEVLAGTMPLTKAATICSIARCITEAIYTEEAEVRIMKEAILINERISAQALLPAAITDDSDGSLP